MDIPALALHPSPSGSPASRRTSERRRQPRPGPILCVAPAGSGKTTTLVARIAWLIASGAARADEIAAITFNKRAADELGERLSTALAPLDVAAGTGACPDVPRPRPGDPAGCAAWSSSRSSTASRSCGAVAPDAGPAGWRSLDTAMSRLKLDLCVTAADVATDDDPGPVARAFIAYEAAVAETGGLDFDDLVARALGLLEADPSLLDRWRRRCAHLLVDEAQDLDRAQLRLALLLAAPENRIFLVGDDDQSIYGWRLADVRRVLSLADDLPGLRRVDLEVNYRCPPTVVARAVRLVEHNRERFAKAIRAGPAASGPIVFAADGSDEAVRIGRVLDGWPVDDGSRAILARTNRELLPAITAALDRRIPFRPPAIELLVTSPIVDEVLAEAAGTRRHGARSSSGSRRSGARWAARPRSPDDDPAEARAGGHRRGRHRLGRPLLRPCLAQDGHRGAAGRDPRAVPR